MRKSFLRKASIVLLSATMLMATACNKEIEVKYDYNVNDYVQLGKYEDIAVTVDKTSIENQLVDDKIAEDIENNTTYSEVSRGAVDGDQILVTYVATSSGSQSTGLSNTDGVTMILGKDKLGLDIEELDEALYGMKAGETKVMVIDLPETYSNTVYAGTKVVFELTVQTVSQPNVPMLTNAYVKETFGYDTIEEYRASVKDSLASTIDSKVDDEIQKQVLSTLQDTCKVSGYPDTLLSTLRDRYDQSVGFYADFTNQSKEEYCQQLYGMSYDDFIKKSAAQQLIMEAIVKDQKFSMREYDYKGDLDEFAGDNGYSDENAFVEKFGKEDGDKVFDILSSDKPRDGLREEVHSVIDEHLENEFKKSEPTGLLKAFMNVFDKGKTFEDGKKYVFDAELCREDLNKMV